MRWRTVLVLCVCLGHCRRAAVQTLQGNKTSDRERACGLAVQEGQIHTERYGPARRWRGVQRAGTERCFLLTQAVLGSKPFEMIGFNGCPLTRRRCRCWFRGRGLTSHPLKCWTVTPSRRWRKKSSNKCIRICPTHRDPK